MQIAKVIEQPHLLFIGANGKKCFGITVENTDSVKVYHENVLARNGTKTNIRY
jgi:hypothetical protein